MIFRRSVACLAVAVSALVGFAVFPSGAIGQVSGSTAPVPIISPTSGPPGTTITVTIPGCTGFVSAALVNPDTGDVLDINVSDGDTTTVVVPAGTAQGSYIVAAGCDVYSENDINGTPFTVVAGAVVATPNLTG